MATGFHGFHVLIGTIFLIVCLIRAMGGDFTPKAHFGFEAAAWYWHFVDVVWLFLFASIYVWASSGRPSLPVATPLLRRCLKRCFDEVGRGNAADFFPWPDRAGIVAQNGDRRGGNRVMAVNDNEGFGRRSSRSTPA